MDRSLNENRRGDVEGEPGEPVRVTDRRRIHLDQAGNEQTNEGGQGPSLKPSYVEELETRTKAAEKLVNEVQARFDQLRQQLQRETDETRQRLNQDFNPELHEAVDTVLVDRDQDEKIVKEYSRGFKIGDRLLRPARVQVGRAREESREASR